MKLFCFSAILFRDRNKYSSSYNYSFGLPSPKPGKLFLRCFTLKFVSRSSNPAWKLRTTFGSGPMPKALKSQILHLSNRPKWEAPVGEVGRLLEQALKASSELAWVRYTWNDTSCIFNSSPTGINSKLARFSFIQHRMIFDAGTDQDIGMEARSSDGERLETNIITQNKQVFGGNVFLNHRYIDRLVSLSYGQSEKWSDLSVRWNKAGLKNVKQIDTGIKVLAPVWSVGGKLAHLAQELDTWS